MSVGNLEVKTLENEMIEWFDRFITEDELDDFKRLDRRGQKCLLYGLYGSNKKVRRIDLLVDEVLYERCLNYPGMVSSWRIKALETFAKKGYQTDMIRQVYAKVMHTNKQRKIEYDNEEFEKNLKGPIGCMVRHKKASIICSVSMAALTIIGIGSCFFVASLWKVNSAKLKTVLLISEIVFISMVILLSIIASSIFIKKWT